MKSIKKIILFIFGLAMFLELLAIPVLFLLNHHCSELINMKKWCLCDLLLLIATYIVGLIFYEITHTKEEKNENKNR